MLVLACNVGLLLDLIVMSSLINVTSARVWSVFLSQGNVNSVIGSKAITTLLLGLAFSSLNSDSDFAKFLIVLGNIYLVL